MPQNITKTITAMRPHQWVKNVLLLAPMILAHKPLDANTVVSVVAAVAAFSLCASSGYVVNDLLDREADRSHPQKRHRPFACGDLNTRFGIGFAVLLLICSLVLALIFVSFWFAAMLIGYLLMTTAYSLYLKQVLMIDVLMLGGFYTYRVLAGAVAASVPVSPWLAAFSMFFFLSLAFVKRYTELSLMQRNSGEKLVRRGYYVEDLPMIRVLGPSAGYLSVLVLALYISSSDVVVLYPHPHWLWLVCLCLLYWLTRVWFLAHRERLSHDPVLFAVRDPVSYAVGLVAVMLVVLASI